MLLFQKMDTILKLSLLANSMKSLIFAILFLLLLLLLSGCASLGESESNKSEKNDYYAIFSSLLGINENRFIYTDNEGNPHSDQLRLFKELEGIYGRYIEPQEDGTYSPEQAKVIMLFAFYATNRSSGAFSEYLASDLMPIYSKNRLMFLELMSELPFLIPSVCNRLNAFFGFEGKNSSGKENFIRDNKVHFEAHFPKKQVKTCLSQFNE